MNEQIHRLSCYVENKPGVLARIVGLISGRGYNIQTLNVGLTPWTLPVSLPSSSTASSASDNRGNLASRCVVAMTRQPIALAIWIVAYPSAQVAPRISSVSSGLSRRLHHSRAMPSFPSQLEWKIGLAWANTRGSLNSPS